MERALLETLKYLSAQDILQITTVCRLWQGLCSCDEIWLHLLGLSRNLLRLQLSPPPSLREAYRLAHVLFCVVPRKKGLHRYYPASKKWKITRMKLDLEETDYVSMISLGTGELFCCGGEDPTKDTYKVSLLTGQVTVLPTMTPHKVLSGVCMQGTYVYSLCGRLQGDLISQCARFNLLHCQWETLPSALHTRQCFTPFSYRGLIYLPGGCNPTVETFNPVTMLFEVLIEDCCLKRPVDSVLWQGQMHILNLDGHFVWDLEHQKGEYTPKHDTYYRGTSCFPPICRDGKAVFVWKSGYRSMAYEMDLETFEYAPLSFQKEKQKTRRKRHS